MGGFKMKYSEQIEIEVDRSRKKERSEKFL
jgi:hypothetical protein